MAPHSVLLVVVLLGLAMAPSDGQSLEFDQSIKANMSSGPSMRAYFGVMGPMAVEKIDHAVRRLLLLKGHLFFQQLARVFPSTAKLHVFYMSPYLASLPAVKKILAVFSAQLRKLVLRRAITGIHADLLRTKTVRELKDRLKGKINVVLIRMP